MGASVAIVLGVACKHLGRTNSPNSLTLLTRRPLPSRFYEVPAHCPVHPPVKLDVCGGMSSQSLRRLQFCLGVTSAKAGHTDAHPNSQRPVLDSGSTVIQGSCPSMSPRRNSVSGNA